MSNNHPDRRSIAAGAAGLAALMAAPAQAQEAAPALTWRFSLDVQVGPAQELGEYGGGRRRVIPITGGRVFGAIEGEVLASGADWQTIRPDGLTLLQARYTLKARDGATIGIVNTGVRRASPAVAARMAAGELVDPSQYYFRANPVFEVGAGPHQWLVENLFVATGERLPDLVRIKVFQLS